MAEIAAKKTFGGAMIAYISPSPPGGVPETLNVHLTFEEGLKLYFGLGQLGQLLGKINSYNRSTSAGQRAAVNLCVHPRKRRITLVEGKLRRADRDATPATAMETNR